MEIKFRKIVFYLFFCVTKAPVHVMIFSTIFSFFQACRMEILIILGTECGLKFIGSFLNS